MLGKDVDKCRFLEIHCGNFPRRLSSVDHTPGIWNIFNIIMNNDHKVSPTDTLLWTDRRSLVNNRFQVSIWLDYEFYFLCIYICQRRRYRSQLGFKSFCLARKTYYNKIHLFGYFCLVDPERAWERLVWCEEEEDSCPAGHSWR